MKDTLIGMGRFIKEEIQRYPELKRYLMLVFAGLLLVSFFVLADFGGRTVTGDLAVEREENSPESVSPTLSEGSFREKDKDLKTSTLVVHVAGRVRNPGIFFLKRGARVAEAIKRAKPLKNACLDALNLAEKVSDGMKIYVPSHKEAEKAGWPLGFVKNNLKKESLSGSSQDGGKEKIINLNTCTKDELEEVPGIGEKTAEKIINYRKQNRGFSSLNELLKIRGIGEKKLNSFKEYFRVK